MPATPLHYPVTPQAGLRNSSAGGDAGQPAPQALFLSFPNMLFSLLTRGQPLMTEVGCAVLLYFAIFPADMLLDPLSARIDSYTN